MMKMRALIFLVPVLFIGCGHPCPPPGELSGTLQECFYVLQVTKIDPAKKEVTAVTHPNRVKENEEYDYYGGPKGDVFTFKVKDFDTVAAAGGQLQAQPPGTPNPKVYLFTGISDSVTLQLVPEATVKKILDEKRLKGGFRYSP